MSAFIGQKHFQLWGFEVLWASDDIRTVKVEEQGAQNEKKRRKRRRRRRMMMIMMMNVYGWTNEAEDTVLPGSTTNGSGKLAKIYGHYPRFHSINIVLRHHQIIPPSSALPSLFCFKVKWSGSKRANWWLFKKISVGLVKIKFVMEA